MTSADNDEAAFALYSGSKELMKRGSFNLCKFATNSASLQRRIDKAEGKTSKTIEDETYAKSTLRQTPIAARGEKKVLGISWNVDTDEFIYNFEHLLETIVHTEPTKRQIVSLSGRFYDPLGVIQPVIVTFKIFFQELCRAGVTWDEPLKGELLDGWQSLVENLRDCQPIRIPRCYSKLF